MEPLRRRLPLLLSLFAAGLVAGVLLQSLSTSERVPQRASEEARVLPATKRRGDTSDVELARAVRELRDTIALLAPLLAERPAPVAPGAPGTRTALDANESSPGSLAGLPSEEALESLAAALHELAQSMRALPSMTTSAAPRLPNDGARAVNLGRLRLPAGAADSSAVREGAQRRMLEEHMLWSVDQLTATYGLPTEIWANDDQTEGWNYVVPVGNGLQEGYNFYVRNDRVIGAEVYIDEVDE